MSLLDKITGLAQKAKENVVSKTFISKDKRLEQSLSESIKVNDIFFQKMSTYGLPSVINVVAYDCVAGLLAVAGDSNHGYIKVFGKGISTTIKLPKPVGIKHLQFKTGFPILVVIDKSNHIVTIDLRTKSIRHVLAAQEIITSQVYCIGTDWLFIGYANGFIDVFDIMQGTLTPYQIPDLLELQQQESASSSPSKEQEDEHHQKTKSKHTVVDLQMHPNELNTLLIGYESIVYMWNIRENTIRKSFSLSRLPPSNQYRNANLTCLAWSPNGARFIAGYDDGSTHLWDIKNDQKPIASRKISHAFSTDNDACEPIYQLAWYTSDTTHKSYIVVAGGSNPAVDIQGLNVLEYDLDSEAKDPKKQTIMPLPTDLSHFVILSTDPYHNGMLNPFGIAAVGVDGCLRAFSFDHTASPLKLPPALEFFGPHVLTAFHVPQLPSTAFKKMAAFTSSDRQIKWFPITGGVAGPEHVYHVDSNDLLLTIHQGEVVKFWDASYTALRPLSHLTIHCLYDVKNPDAFLCCLDVNKETGALTIGFSDGSIVVYECQVEQKPEPTMDPRLMAARHQEFIDNCDDTLKEISDLLEDMGHDEEGEEHHETVAEDGSNTNPFVTNTTNAATTPSLPPHQPPPQQRQPDDSKNPFVAAAPFPSAPTTSSTNQVPSATSAPYIPNQQQPHSEFQSPEIPSRKSSKIFKKLDKSGDASGYYASLLISLNSPIKSVVSVGDSVIAVATDDGRVTVIDIYKQMVLFKHNIAQSDFHNTVEVPAAANLKSEVANDLQEADPAAAAAALEEKKPATITTLSFFNTYSPSKVMTATTQLFVGLSNGHVYQFNLALLVERGPSIAATELMNDYLSMRVIPTTLLLDLFVIDLKGKSQLAIVELETTLSKESSHHSADTTASSVDNHENCSEAVSSPKPISVRSNRSRSSSVSSAGAAPSKRMAAIGRAEYRHQENPHLIVSISLTGVSVSLSGYNVRLFSREFKDFTIVCGEIIDSHHGVCLCLVLSTGKGALYSLPTLELMLEMNLPTSCLLGRLGESSISRDGRIVFWSGKYEMEQFSFTPKPNFPLGESVILFDPHREIPPHPSLIQQQQKPKKTWLDTVAGAFTREPLTLPELDLLMGRQPMEDPNEVRKQKIEAYKAKHAEPSSGSSSKGPGGVFNELGDKVNERGERLNELNQKFEDMNAASGDFLKAVKEYNDRQARKKWWEF